MFTHEHNKTKLQTSTHKFWVLRKKCKSNLEMVPIPREERNLRRHEKRKFLLFALGLIFCACVPFLRYADLRFVSRSFELNISVFSKLTDKLMTSTIACLLHSTLKHGYSALFLLAVNRWENHVKHKSTRPWLHSARNQSALGAPYSIESAPVVSTR